MPNKVLSEHFKIADKIFDNETKKKIEGINHNEEKQRRIEEEKIKAEEKLRIIEEEKMKKIEEEKRIEAEKEREKRTQELKRIFFTKDNNKDLKNLIR